MGALGFLSYMVYGHHMFVSGMNPFSSLAFSFPTLMITIPATIIVLIWIGSLYGSQAAHQLGFAVCAGLYFDVCQRRRQRLLPGAAFDRHHAARHLLRGRPLPHGDGRRGHVRHLRRNLFLVPQDDRDE